MEGVDEDVEVEVDEDVEVDADEELESIGRSGDEDLEPEHKSSPSDT